MNIYDYIKKDHDKVTKLFKNFVDSTIPERQVQIVEMIVQELVVHAHAEEKVFYKALEKFYDSKDEIHHGKKEHDQIEAKIKELNNSKPSSPPWQKQVEELSELVAHHVEEEEKDIFKKAKENLSEDEAYTLKEQMHDMKRKILEASV